MIKMANPESFYITTTLPYVNAPPHMGHAVEFARADMIARHKEMKGVDVFLNTGTDEHGLKIYREAEKKGEDPSKYVDRLSDVFRDLTVSLNMRSDLNFIRTTDEHHKKATEAFWKRCLKNGDIYKKNYKVCYCVGCELEKSLSDLVDGRCPDHPDRELEMIEEENYFFRFSRYQKALLEMYENDPDFVIPDFRLNEIKSFVERGLEDFSVSRLATKQPWGIPVPNDPEHTMYVWFDALVNYVSAIGWPNDIKSFKRWWPVTQYAGKDNLRQQSAMWQAMLMSAGLPCSKRIIINGFIISDGKKMSKSIGNVIDPFDLIKRYGTDALRYYIAREVHPFEDSDMTEDRFKEAYNANLANGLGNSFSRIIKMAHSYEVNYGKLPDIDEVLNKTETEKNYHKAFESFEINKASDHVWSKISFLDKVIDETQPFKKIKIDRPGAEKDIIRLIHGLWEISVLLIPLMPESAKSIMDAIEKRLPPETPLFIRK